MPVPATFPAYIADTVASNIAGSLLGASGVFLSGAAIDLIFSSGQYFGVVGAPTSFLTTTRASSAFANDASGNWISFANNIPRITSSGLLVEESRTNQATNSAAPTGGNGWTLENLSTALQAGQGPGTGLDSYLYDDGVTAGVSHRLSPASNMAFVSGTTYALSVFVQYVNSQFVQIIFPSGAFGATAYANFDILNGVFGTVGAAATATITAYPNGWKRIEITAPATASVGSLNTNIQRIATGTDARAATNNGNHNQFSIWNMQVETGTSITSPIVTAGAAGTRAADLASMTTSPTFGAAYSMFVLGTPQAPIAFGTAQNFLQIDAGSDAQRTLLRREITTGRMLFSTVGGTGLSTTPATVFNPNVSTKWGAALAAGDQQLYVDSISGGATVAAALPTTPTAVRFGSNASSTEFANGFIARVALWPTTRISNALLQSITT